MPIVVHKALAYITHRNRLLVFSHPRHPEAGIQVPAGTVQDGERPEDAVTREAFEETGLASLTLAGFLGEEVRDISGLGVNQVHHRHFFHLRCDGDPPERWRHFETDPSDGSPGPIEFEFFWARLPDGVPELIADHDHLLPQLLDQLGLSRE